MDVGTERYEASTPDVVAESLGGELLVLNLDTGVYFRGDRAASAAWEALASGVPLDRFPGGSRTELDGFVRDLLSAGLLRPRRPDAPGAVPPTSVTLPDGALKLERFEDLAEMLALDPVHDVDVEKGWPTPK